MSILDIEEFSSIVFYPRKVKKPLNLPSNIDTLELTLSNNITIGGLMFTNSKDLPTILLFHGNGEVCTDYLSFYEGYTSSGANFAVVDYQGYGFSEGSPRYSQLLTESNEIYLKILELLRSKNYSDNIIVMGRSLGSACASEIGANNPDGLLGIIFESGFASVYHLMEKLFMLDLDGITEEMVYPYSNEIRIKKITKPVLIIHGEMDRIIPYSEGESINDHLGNEEYKKLVKIQNAGHNDLILRANIYFKEISEFISKVLDVSR